MPRALMPKTIPENKEAVLFLILTVLIHWPPKDGISLDEVSIEQDNQT